MESNQKLTLGSLFSGCGGIDLAMERAGFIPKWQIEKDKYALKALEIHFPNVKRYNDATQICFGELERVYFLVGGDPCPIRSKAKMGAKSQHPDLASYFLEAVRQLRPVWVLRENVPNPDANQFALCLEWMGYRTVILEVDSATVTSQSRAREVIIGCFAASGYCPSAPFSQQPRRSRRLKALAQGRSPLSLCLTTQFKQYSYTNNFVSEPERGIRILAPIERARLQGYSDDWLSEFSSEQQCRMYGNSVTVDVFEQIGLMLRQYLDREPKEHNKWTSLSE